MLFTKNSGKRKILIVGIYVDDKIYVGDDDDDENDKIF